MERANAVPVRSFVRLVPGPAQRDPDARDRVPGFTGKPLAQPRGRALWPKAIPRPMRFHDLRHTTATLLLRAGVDAHRVQRLLRHRDVRTTTTIYGHLDVEDLRAALEKLPQLGPIWVQAAQSHPEPPASTSANSPDSQDLTWWALQDSNLRPLPCEGSALPLS